MLDRQNEYPLQDAENGAAALTRKVSFLSQPDSLGRVKTALGVSAVAASAQLVFQVAIAAISGLTPTMFMTRVRL